MSEPLRREYKPLHDCVTPTGASLSSFSNRLLQILSKNEREWRSKPILNPKSFFCLFFLCNEVLFHFDWKLFWVDVSCWIMLLVLMISSVTTTETSFKRLQSSDYEETTLSPVHTDHRTWTERILHQFMTKPDELRLLVIRGFSDVRRLLFL